MVTAIPFDEPDETDLRDVALALWSGKAFVLAGMVIAGAIAALSAPVEQPVYSATALFAHPEPSVLDRINSPAFILSAGDQLSLRSDAVFLQQGGTQGSWLDGLTAASVKNPEPDLQAAFQAAVKTRKTRNQAFEVTVTHPVATRAADIANGIVMQLAQEMEHEQQTSQEQILAPLEAKLAAVIEKLSDTGGLPASPAVGQAGGSERTTADTGLGQGLSQERLVALAEYQSLLARIRAETEGAALQAVPVRLFQPAVAPDTAVRTAQLFPRMALGTLIGAILGGAVAFLLAMRSQRIFAASTITAKARPALTIKAWAAGSVPEGPDATNLLIMMRRAGPRFVLVAATAPEIDAAPVAIGLARMWLANGHSPALLMLANSSATASPDIIPVIRPANRQEAERILTTDALARIAGAEGRDNDCVFIVADSDLAPSVARAALGEGALFVVAVTAAGISRKPAIEALAAICPIDAELRL